MQVQDSVISYQSHSWPSSVILLSIKCKSLYSLRCNLLELLNGKIFNSNSGHVGKAAALHLWNELPLQLSKIKFLEIKTCLLRQFFSSKFFVALLF